jgi:putative phage-type endonuclease
MAMAELKLERLDPGFGIKANVIADASIMEEKDWLQLRRHYLGASEVAAVLDLNPYRSGFGIYADKVLGSTEDLSDNIHIQFGNWMEPVILAEFPKRFLKEEGVEIKAHAYPYMLQHPEHDFLSVNLDGIVSHPEHGVGVIEIKTASEMQWKEWQDDDIPAQYYVQIQQELSITGLPYAYVVALVGKRLLWKYIPRNNEFIRLVTGILIEFWNNHIVAKEAPLPAGLEDDTKTLKRLYGSEEPGSVVEMHDYQTDYDRYKELAKEIKELGQEQEAIKQKFMQTMGLAEVAFIGNKKITWKTTERKGYEVKPTSFRAMRIN